METISLLQDQEATEEQKQKSVELVRSLLNDLENNPFINKLSISDFENSKAINDLLRWFKSIQEDGFDFTKKSIQQYVSWANHYLPTLIILADQLEQQNYLKSGSLTTNLCSQVEQLGKQVNEILSESSFGIEDRVVTIESLKALREQRIDATQVKSVGSIVATEGQQIAAADFYRILQAYKGMSLAQITEPDRVLLRPLYPKIQMALAHANLDLENQLTTILNTTGPEKTTPQPRSWWQLAADGLGYLASYVVNYEVDKLLGTQEAVARFMSSQIASEQFKLTIAEKAREKLADKSDDVTKIPLEEKVDARINAIKSALRKQPPQPEVPPSQLVAVKPGELVNLRGTLTAIQEMKLSTTVNNTRISIDTLIRRHLAEKYQAHFSTLPYKINKDDPELVVQIKTVENNLYQLEKSLSDFEGLDLSYGIMIRLQYYIAIASAASKLRSSITALSPDTQKILSPLLQQINAYGLSFSDMNYKDSDLSSLEQLKKGEPVSREENHHEKIPPSPEIEVPNQSTKKVNKSSVKPQKIIEKPSEKTEAVVVKKTEQISQKTEKPVAKEKSSALLDYADKIGKTRAVLLDKFKTTLSAPLTTTLNPQEKGVPFVDFEQDPPQIATIKKMINSMHYAECALKIWHGIDTSTTFGKIAAVHQGVAALSQVYKSFTLFTENSSEIQTLFRDNYEDLIAPIINEAANLVKQYGWTNQFREFEVTKKLGSILGQGINTVQPQTEKNHTTPTSSLVKLFSELPTLLNNIASTFNQAAEKPSDELKVDAQKIAAIGAVFELFFEEHADLFGSLKGFHAIDGLLDLNKKIQREGTNLQEATIKLYQEWLKDSYSHLMMILDEVETRYYLTPGLLSAPIALEIDRINDKLNETIETKPKTSLKTIPLSFDMGKVRKEQLIARKSEQWLEIFQIEEQQNAAKAFFEILKQQVDRSFSDIAPSELAKLRLAFAKIQLAFANSNLELTNEFIVALNQLETLPPEDAKKIKLNIHPLLQLETSIDNYLNERKKSYELKMRVIDNAIKYVQSKSFGLPSDSSEDINVPQLRKQFLDIERGKPAVGPGELKPTPISSLNTVRGNLAYIQELQLSSVVILMREEFSSITKNNFSSRIQSYLNKPVNEPLHVINNTDPIMVRQIKEFENGLYHLETALKQFEQMNKSDSLVSQAKALLEITYNARQLKVAVEQLTPELKHHYGPLANTVINFSQKVRSLDYNKKDWADLQFVLSRTHKELLKRKKPRDPRIEKAFFEAGVREIQSDSSESAGKKAAKLGIKYSHLVSPQLEKARAYLSSKYNDVFGVQPGVVRSLTREQLANDDFMHIEIKRLKKRMEKDYGFNITTIKILLDLLEQIQRAGSQTAELAGMVNTLVTYDFSKIKENTYRELITKLSEEEDYLCLKPGTLINPAMAAVNQLFLSAALELDMPFSKKLAILDEATYSNILIEQAESEIQALKKKLTEDPLNPEIAFQVAIKEDKINFLKQQIALMADKDPNKTKSALLDIQFEVSLRHHLTDTTLKGPIGQQYGQAVRQFYEENKTRLLSVDDCSNELLQSIKEFEKNNLADYLIVYEAYERLRIFALKLPAKNQDVRDYIGGINRELTNGDIPIKERALKVKSLPHDRIFIKKLSSADEGTSFLRKFIQFIEIITSSISEAIKTGRNLIHIYREKQMEQSIKNIEKSIGFKKELNSIKDDFSPNEEEDRSKQPH
nr:SdhB [Legionella norrlandica]